ncbi:DUF1801 domain-containing protein [Nocardia huaxiensis]|uniref:DUF1801 domain-containing protein n=1 Tax=Nocardia huaxiensis TaxID=2755382 RepID=A0A7D6VA81_9NOCA|nr:DUF1801 domain-containing protein [Nocardia huaxiensis]QLY27997.1 DUF1801 domain-containing protein [Nocardia huaxiensis]UFS98598.1 DUF1801 domain-containing protein [Nocardia huaxiensis]
MATSSTGKVEQFLADSSHPRKPEIEQLRKAILGANPGITEQIKWNAPSFCINGDDRITMRLQPKDVLDLIFHLGAKKRDADTATFEFDDPSGLIRWLAPGRGIIEFRDHDDLTAKLPAVVELADRWMKATAT